MKITSKPYRFSFMALITSLVSMAVIPAIAREPKSNLILATGFDRAAAIAIGHTGGAYSLASIVNQDKHGNPCMGYGDPKPDHSMVLENDFDRLSLQVDSGGKDTTLVIKGPDNDFRCAFGQKQIRDALVQDQNWKQGHYDIWVGSMQPTRRSPYRLSIQQ